MRVPVIGAITRQAIVVPSRQRIELTIPEPDKHLAALTHQFGDHRDRYAIVFSPDKQVHPSMLTTGAAVLLLKGGEMVAGNPVYKGNGRYDIYIWNQCIRRDAEIETAMPAQIVF
jgi:hypothetical protein